MLGELKDVRGLAVFGELERAGFHIVDLIIREALVSDTISSHVFFEPLEHAPPGDRTRMRQREHAKYWCLTPTY
jgi:hypothetical protein